MLKARVASSVLAAMLVAATWARVDAQIGTKGAEHSSEAGALRSRRIVVPLAHGGDFLFAKVRVNDADVGWWLVHTGDPGILIDAGVAQRLGLPVVEKMWGAGKDDPDASLVLLGKLQVGPIPAKSHLAVAMDLSQWRRDLGVDISGILGWGFLRDQPFAIDFRAGTLTLFSPGDAIAPAKPTFAGSLHMLTGAPSVPGNLDGRYSGWFKIDSAESSPLFLSAIFSALHTEAWSERPLNVASRFEAMSALGISRPVIARWESKGSSPEHPELLMSGSVGAPYLRTLSITFGSATDQLWAERLADGPLDAFLSRLGDPKGHDLAGVTPLMRAAADGRADATAALVNQGADVNAVDARGRTPLTWACEAGNVAIVKLLLAQGARPDAADRPDGSAALIAAIAAGRMDIVQLLLDAGARPDHPDLAGVLPLLWAVANDRDKIVTILVNHGANPAFAGPDGLSPFVAAAEWNAAQSLQALLRRGIPPADPKTGRTLLMEAAFHNAVGAVRELIEAGADVNARTVDGKTALMEAARNGSTDALRLLLSAGADPCVRSAEGNDAWTYAFEAGKQCDAMLLYPLAHRAVPGATQPSTRPASVLIRAQRGGPFLFVPASIDGQQPIPMLLDTGALGIFIDKPLAEQLCLRPILRVDDRGAGVSAVEVPHLHIGGISMGPTFAFAMDLSGFRKALGIRGPLIMGMPFVDAPIRIDFPAAEVEVYERSAFRPPLGVPEIPLRIMSSARLCVPAVLFGTDHVLLGIDTGSMSEVDLSGAYMLLHADELGARLDAISGQGVAERVETLRYRLNDIDALGHRDGNLTVDVRLSNPGELAQHPPGAIGARMLQRCTLWLDTANGRAWAHWVQDNQPLDAFLGRISTEPAADILHTTPLLRAVEEGRDDAVAALLNTGAKPDESDYTGATPLLLACSHGDQRTADLLLDHHAKANQKDLRAAAARGLTEVVDRLIRAGLPPGKDASTGLVPLHWAALRDNSECTESLLRAGADPNEAGSDDVVPPLVEG